MAEEVKELFLHAAAETSFIHKSVMDSICEVVFADPPRSERIILTLSTPRIVDIDFAARVAAAMFVVGRPAMSCFISDNSGADDIAQRVDMWAASMLMHHQRNMRDRQLQPQKVWGMIGYNEVADHMDVSSCNYNIMFVDAKANITEEMAHAISNRIRVGCYMVIYNTDKHDKPAWAPLLFIPVGSTRQIRVGDDLQSSTQIIY